MSRKKLVIVGAGEIAAVAFEYFTHDSGHEVAGFSVEEKYRTADRFSGLPLVDFSEMEKHFPPSDHDAFVAVNDMQLNRVRARLYSATKEKGYRLASYVSSRAFVWHDAKIGDNCFILEDNTIQPFVTIGNNVTLWSGNHIGHRVTIEDHCFITSHVVLSGFCRVGACSFIGVNACIANTVRIAPDNYIAMASAIGSDTEPDRIYQGNPAEMRKVSAKRFNRVKEQ